MDDTATIALAVGGMGCSLLIPWRPGRLWAAGLLPVTSTALTHVQGQGEGTQLCLQCSVHATLPGAGVVHDAAHLLRRNVMLQFNSHSSECFLSGDGRGEERVPLLHVTTLQAGNRAAAGAEGLLLPGALVCFLPGSRSREECWWEALSFTLPTKISCT